jgi:hypothetical protein
MFASTIIAPFQPISSPIQTDPCSSGMVISLLHPEKVSLYSSVIMK